MTKIALVVQRYGADIVGGAESLCRQIAERLVQDLNWSVTVYTSQARDYVTWRNELTTANENINGVRVKRYPVLFPRSTKLFGFVNQKLSSRLLNLKNRRRPYRMLGYWLERLWIILQGPYCPGLVRSLKREAQQYDKVFFFTYLYYPTLLGAKSLGRLKYTLIPTAHNEAPFFFQHTQELLKNCHRIFVNIQPEQALIDGSLGTKLNSIQTAGLGFDIPSDSGDPAPETPPESYILYLGRICTAKGVAFLIEVFQRWQQAYPEKDLKLYLVGKKDEDFVIPKGEHIRYLGFVDDLEKFRLIRGSRAVVNPSQYESLSMIAIEAMVCLKPVILNRASEVLAYYCDHVPTALGYGNEVELMRRIDEITSTNWQSPDSIRNLNQAKNWAEKHYSWSVVLDAYRNAPRICEPQNPQSYFNKVPTT